MRKEIVDAATWALTDIAKVYGRLPKTIAECIEVTQAYAVRTMDAGSGPVCLLVTKNEIPTIFYDFSATPHRQKLAIIHELVEWLMMDKYPQLRDWSQPHTCNQNGGDTPGDLAHQVSLFCEQIYEEWLKREE